MSQAVLLLTLLHLQGSCSNRAAVPVAGIYICGCDFHAVISKPWLLEAIKVCGCGSGAVIYKPRIKRAMISKPWLLEAIKVCGCGSGAVIYKPRIASSELKADRS